ncbi:MAG: Zn-ribbon domain-containing OB-fold protein [Deltaproteobacteria bacterium]|nr:Zn-ribbon domain-containing OB-fold protein [Deltaproteobacteria bacterium]
MDIKEQLKQKLNLSDADFAKPMPIPTKWSRPFWDGAGQHKLLLKQCKDCGHIDHPPYLYCTECHSDDHEWIEASGKATLYAFAINEYGVPFPFMPDLPYVLGLVDLKEGPRMITNIVECDHNMLKNGMELEVVFEDVSKEVSLPKWKPIKP